MAKQQETTVFDGYGLELSYHLVERGTLNLVSAMDIAKVPTDLLPSLQKTATGIRLRMISPEKSLVHAAMRISADVKKVNAFVGGSLNATLLPTGGHPWAEVAEVGPFAEAALEIPFGDEQGFGRLHTAVRMVLPLLPAIGAGSPFRGGQRISGLSARLLGAMDANKSMPERVGSFIPEVALDQADYYRIVLGPIARALADRNLSEQVDYHAMNRRAATASFERGTISITVADTQECPSSDAAIAEMTGAVVNAMKAGRWVSNYLQRAWHESDLLAILKDVTMRGRDTVIHNRDFLLMFGMMRETATAGELWRHLYQQLRDDLSESTRIRIAHILDHGSLAERILRRTGDRPSREQLLDVYAELSMCLNEDQPFV